MLERLGDIVESLEQDFLARRRDFKIIDQTVIVADGLIGQIEQQGIAHFRFRAAEELFDFAFAENRGQNAVLEAIIVENVGVAGSDDGAEAVVLDAPWRVLAAGAAAKVRASQEHGSALVAR